MSLMGRRVARIEYFGSKHRPTRLTERRTKSNLKRMITKYYIFPYTKAQTLKFMTQIIRLVEKTYMFQNLVKYPQGPSAMILRMFSTMYTGRGKGNMVLGFRVMDKSVCHRATYI